MQCWKCGATLVYGGDGYDRCPKCNATRPTECGVIVGRRSFCHRPVTVEAYLELEDGERRLAYGRCDRHANRKRDRDFYRGSRITVERLPPK